MVIMGYKINLRNLPLRIATFATGMLAVLSGKIGEFDPIPAVTCAPNDHYFGLTSPMGLTHLLAVNFDAQRADSSALEVYNKLNKTLTAGICHISYEPQKHGDHIPYPLWDNIYSEHIPKSTTGWLDLRAYSFTFNLYNHDEDPVLVETEKCLKSLLNDTVSDVREITAKAEFRATMAVAMIYGGTPVLGALFVFVGILRKQQQEEAAYKAQQQANKEHKAVDSLRVSKHSWFSEKHKTGHEIVSTSQARRAHRH